MKRGWHEEKRGIRWKWNLTIDGCSGNKKMMLYISSGKCLGFVWEPCLVSHPHLFNSFVLNLFSIPVSVVIFIVYPIPISRSYPVSACTIPFPILKLNSFGVILNPRSKVLSINLFPPAPSDIPAPDSIWIQQRTGMKRRRCLRRPDGGGKLGWIKQRMAIGGVDRGDLGSEEDVASSGR